MNMPKGAGPSQDRFRKVVAPLARRLWKIRAEGFDRIPATGPAVLCPNHISFLDSAFLMLLLSRRISFVGKAEYMDSWKTKHIFPMLGMIPIDRSGGKRSMVALDAAEEVLQRGELMGIFPEGTRSRDGYLYKGHTGAARLAVKVGCPIIPIGIVGTDDIQPPDAKMPKPFRSATFAVGRPIKTDRYHDRSDQHFAFRQIIDEVMYEIRELTGQEYRNVYATKKAEDLPAEPARVMTAEDLAEATPALTSVG